MYVYIYICSTVEQSRTYHSYSMVYEALRGQPPGAAAGAREERARPARGGRPAPVGLARGRVADSAAKRGEGAGAPPVPPHGPGAPEGAAAPPRRLRAQADGVPWRGRDLARRRGSPLRSPAGAEAAPFAHRGRPGAPQMETSLPLEGYIGGPLSGGSYPSLPVSVKKTIPRDEKTLVKINLQSAKSVAGQQFLPLDCRAKAHSKGMCF